MVKETPPMNSIEKKLLMPASWIGNTEKENEKVNEPEWENITVKARQIAHTMTRVHATWMQRGFCVHKSMCT